MSTKMLRRAAQRRLKARRRERRELGLFFAHGRFPSNAVTWAICSCGARAFSTDPHDTLDDFDAAHAYCTEDY